MPGLLSCRWPKQIQHLWKPPRRSFSALNTKKHRHQQRGPARPIVHRSDVSLVERETKDTQRLQSTDEDTEIEAQETGTLHQMQEITLVPIIDHPVVSLNVMRRRLKQEVSVTLAPYYVVRVSYYICFLSLAERCYRCGKIGHIKKNCVSATRKRAPRQTVRYVFSASTIHFHQG